MMSVQRLRRAEIWSDLQCAGGVRVKVLRKLFSAQASAQLTGDSMLTLTMPIEAASGITEKQVIRIDESDASFDEWRVLTASSDSASGNATITAEPIENLLADPALVAQVDGLGVTRHDIDVVSLTPTEILEQFVLPACPAWVSLGTIDATDPVDVTFKWATPLAAIRQLAELTGMEFQLRRNGTVGYLIDLVTAIGSAAAVADLRAAKNLPQLVFGTSAQQQYTRIYPKGAEVDGVSGTMGRAAWTVATVNGQTLALSDPAGGDGPIGFDGQLVGMMLRCPDGTLTQVTASTYAGQTVSIALVGAPVAPGDLVEFRAADGSELTYLESPADVAGSGIRSGTLERSDIPDTVNIVPNADLRSWPQGNAMPDDWTLLGGAVAARETIQKELGAQSLQLTCANDGDGVETALAALELTADAPYASGYGKLFVESGQVRVELVAWDGAVFTTYPGDGDVASSSQRGVWLDLGVAGIDLHAIGAESAKLRIVQHGAAAAVFYVNAAQLTNSAGQLDFLSGRGPNQLWQAANEQLRTSAGPVISLAAQLVELAAIDPARWGADSTIVLGGSVRVTEPRVTTPLTTRVIALTRDYLQRGRTTVTLSNKPLDLTGILARPARGKRIGGAPNPLDGAVLPTVTPSIIPETATQGGVQLTITDPQARVTKVEARTQRGNATPTDWAVIAPPYQILVDLVDKQPSKVGWRVTGYDTLGVERILFSGSETCAIGSRPIPPVIQPSVAQDGTLGARFVCDTDAATIKYAVATDGSQPSDDVVRAALGVNVAATRTAVASTLATLQQLGQVYCIVAFAYNAAGAESDRAVFKAPWVAVGNAALQLGAAEATQTQITVPVTLGPSATMAEFWYLEYPAAVAPADPVSVEMTGAPVPGSPVRRLPDGTQSADALTIPVAQPGNIIMLTGIASDGFTRAVFPVLERLVSQAQAPPQLPPDITGQPTVVGTPGNGSATIAVPMPASLGTATKIRSFRDGTPYGSDVAITVAGGASQNLTHTGLSSGARYTWTYKLLDATGNVSANFSPAVTITMPGGGGAPVQLAAPTAVEVGPYDVGAQGYVFTLTPAAGMPSGTTYRAEENSNFTGWGFLEQAFPGDNTCNHPQPTGGASDISQVRVKAQCAGYLDSDYTTADAVNIPPAGGQQT